MNLSFDIIAGKIDSRAYGDSQPQQLIKPGKFIESYEKYCSDLLDKQEIFKLIDRMMLAAETGLERMSPNHSIGFNGIIVEDSVCVNHAFFIGADDIVFVKCDVAVTLDIFADEDNKLNSSMLYTMVRDAIKNAMFDAQLQNVVCNIELY